MTLASLSPQPRVFIFNEYRTSLRLQSGGYIGPMWHRPSVCRHFATLASAWQIAEGTTGSCLRQPNAALSFLTDPLPRNHGSFIRVWAYRGSQTCWSHTAAEIQSVWAVASMTGSSPWDGSRNVFRPQRLREPFPNQRMPVFDDAWLKDSRCTTRPGIQIAQ